MASEINVPETICPGCTGAPDSITRAVINHHQRCAEELWKLTMAPLQTNPPTRWERHVQKEALGKATFSLLQAAISTKHGSPSSSWNPIAFFKRCYEDAGDLLERPAKALIMRVVISKKNLEMLVFLLHRPHDDYCATFSCGKRGVSAMHLAAFGGDMRLVVALYEASRDQNMLLTQLEAKVNVRGENCFHAAVYGGHMEVVRFLLSTVKMNSGPVSQKGICPVHIAAENGDIEMLKLLIEGGGADPSPGRVYTAFGTWGGSLQPVLLAAGRGHWDCVEYLVSRGAYTDQLFSAQFDIRRSYKGAPVPCQLEVRFGVSLTLSVEAWLARCSSIWLLGVKELNHWAWLGGE